jgi:hypothetical protein
MDRCEFDYMPIKHFMGEDVPIHLDDDELVVFRNCYFHDKRVRTNSPPLDWEVCTRFQEAPTRAGAQDRSGATSIPKDVKKRLMQEYPWLRDSDFRSMRGDVPLRPCDAAAVPDGSVEGGLHDPEDDPNVDPKDKLAPDVIDELVEPYVADEVDFAIEDEPAPDDEVDAELARIREDFSEEMPIYTYFYKKVLGGRWTSTHLGVVADACGGYPRRGLPDNWCIEFKFPRSMRFNFAKYSDEGSDALAKEFCMRGDHFFRIWLENVGGGVPFRYTADALNSYEDNLEFLDWLIAQPIDSPGYIRGQQFRAILPTNPA